MRKLIYVTLAAVLVITGCKKEETTSIERDVNKERIEQIARKYGMVLTPVPSSDTTLKPLTEKQLIQLLEKQKGEIEKDRMDTAKKRLIENMKQEMLKSKDICFVSVTKTKIDNNEKQIENYIPGGKEATIPDGSGGSFIVHIDYNIDKYGNITSKKAAVSHIGFSFANYVVIGDPILTSSGSTVYFRIRIAKQSSGSILGYNFYYNSAVTLTGYVDHYIYGGYGFIENDYFYNDPYYPIYEIPVYDPYYDQIKTSPGYNPTPGNYPTF